MTLVLPVAPNVQRIEYEAAMVILRLGGEMIGVRLLGKLSNRLRGMMTRDYVVAF